MGIKITEKKRLKKALVEQKPEGIIEAIVNVVQAAETVVQRIQYGFSPDLATLEVAVIHYWQQERELK